jgi:hypothetical protein
MPAKINMFISNGNIFPPQMQQVQQMQQAVKPKANVPLNAGMIARIHSIKPGCGSCGRKG